MVERAPAAGGMTRRGRVGAWAVVVLSPLVLAFGFAGYAMVAWQSVAHPAPRAYDGAAVTWLLVMAASLVSLSAAVVSLVRDRRSTRALAESGGGR